MSKYSDYYVYILFDDLCVPRYVGKGRGDRWRDHEKDPGNHNFRKTKFINQTLASIDEIPKVKWKENLTNEKANLEEIYLISKLGRLDLGTGPLTNMSAGGDGGDFGISISATKSQWTTEKRAEVSKKAREGALKFLASLTPRERAKRETTRILAIKKAAKCIRKTDPDYHIRRIKKVKEAWSKRTPEQNKVSTDLALRSNPPKRRSRTTRQWHASRTPEERSATIKKGWIGLTPEERSKRARGPNFNHQQRSNRIRRQHVNLTPKQKAARKKRAYIISQLNLNTRWITDGQINKRLKQNKRLPNGWTYGRKP